MKNYIKNLKGGIKFLISIVFIYVILFFVNSSFIINSLGSTLKSFVDLLPMLVFVFFVIFIVNFFLKPEMIKRHFGNESGLKGWVYAFLGSIFISGPPYIMWPMLKEFKEHGMKYSLVAVFMNNRNVQPAFLPVMIYYFGLSFTIVISIYILLFAVFNALIIGKIMDKNIEKQKNVNNY